MGQVPLGLRPARQQRVIGRTMAHVENAKEEVLELENEISELEELKDG
jgi:hypothetical protein